jgi:glyoxylase-like metal-dependent hydrolase (beta-lactamase superfamily II)
MMKRPTNLMFALLATCGILSSVPAAGQEAPGPAKLTVHPLAGGAYWIEGGSSNEGFVVGTRGVFVFDAQMTPDTAASAIAAIKQVTPKPIDTVIVSHADPDHVGGLPAFPHGIEIIAQENTRAQIIASAADVANGGPYAAIYQKLVDGLLPTKALSGTEDLTIDGVRARLYYFGPVHSSGDLVLYLPAQKIVFGGDILLTSTGRFPVIHIGGSSLGWITAVKTILALDADVYVPGHGAIESKAKLEARLHDVEQRREDVKRMVYAGKTLAEVEQALPETGASPMFLNFTQTVYHELADGYPPQKGPWANLIKH